jgi:hypothetical protein
VPGCTAAAFRAKFMKPSGSKKSTYTAGLMRIGFMRPPAFGSSNQSVPVAPACTIFLRSLHAGWLALTAIHVCYMLLTQSVKTALVRRFGLD